MMELRYFNDLADDKTTQEVRLHTELKPIVSSDWL